MKPGHYPLAWNREGRMGYKIGYCECGEDIVLPFNEFEEISDAVHDEYLNVVDKLIPKPKVKERAKKWLIKKLGGSFETDGPQEKKLVERNNQYYRL